MVCRYPKNKTVGDKAGNVSSETIKWYVDTQKTRP